MTIKQIEEELERLTRAERRITNDVLRLIIAAEEKRLPQMRGFSNTAAWLVKTYHYSEAAAYRRVQSARLLRDNPELEEKIEKGVLNLTSIAKMQNVANEFERQSGKFVDRRAVLKKIENMNMREVESTLASEFPEVAAREESLQFINGNESRLILVIDNEFRKLLENARDYLSHSIPGASLREVIRRALMKNVKRSSTIAKKRRVIDRAGGRCEWVDFESGRRCDSKRYLQVDHIIPKAKGGSDDPSNLRCLCRSHNLYEAEQAYGREKIDKYRIARH